MSRTLAYPPTLRRVPSCDPFADGDTYGSMASAAIAIRCQPRSSDFLIARLHVPGRRPRPIHGNVTFPASTRRRSKTCRDPFAASSMTAQSRCSSTSLPPLMAHNRPAPPGWSRGRARRQPNRVAAFQPNSAARPAQFSPPVKKLLQSLKNWRHRCGAKLLLPPRQSRGNSHWGLGRCHLAAARIDRQQP
jgi:hypothetical protein